VAEQIEAMQLDGNFDRERRRLNELLLQCTYLQVLDFLTTIAFLLHRVQEANPLVQFFVREMGNPISGVLAVKLLGVLMGLYCWRSRRAKLVARMNYFFGFLIVWNLVALILAPL
jgi:Domain of unknown function (DUF5658)